MQFSISLIPALKYSARRVCACVCATHVYDLIYKQTLGVEALRGAYSPTISASKLRNFTKMSIKTAWYPSRESKLGCPEYEIAVISQIYDVSSNEWKQEYESINIMFDKFKHTTRPEGVLDYLRMLRTYMLQSLPYSKNLVNARGDLNLSSHL